MPVFLIKLRCKTGHEQEIGLEASTREVADDYAGFVSGRSRYFVVPVPETRAPNSVGLVGWCGICGARIQDPEISEVP
jgi:hypothetical protein